MDRKPIDLDALKKNPEFPDHFRKMSDDKLREVFSIADELLELCAGDKELAHAVILSEEFDGEEK